MPEERRRTVTQTALEIRRVKTMSTIIANQLSTAAAKTTLDIPGLVTMMKANGMADVAIKEALMADLTAGGRLFGSFRNQVKSNVRSGIRMAGNRGSMSTYRRAGVKEFVWVTVSSNPCPDCDARAGTKGTMEYFENIGTPGSGFSVCQAHCHCQLESIGYRGDKSLTR